MALTAPFRLEGTGCCLMDLLHTHVDFGSEAFRRVASRRPGDGGLEPGKLVFFEDFDRHAGGTGREALAALARPGTAPARNIGGPGVVAMVLASQLLDDGYSLGFTAARGDDDLGRDLDRLLALTPLGPPRWRVGAGATPFTSVLSDPRFDGGRGERTFLNDLGAAARLGPEHLPSEFWQADLVLFGGTGLVPRLHDALDTLLPRARAAGAYTVVSTVYDFRNERRDPAAPWPLGSGPASYAATDLLITDREEALRLSGAPDVDAALTWFLGAGVGAVAVTCGPEPVQTATADPRWGPPSRRRYPVSARVAAALAAPSAAGRDTTGAGDNFTGGLIASVARQARGQSGGWDWTQALAWAVCAGGLACLQVGGVAFEDRPGRRLAQLEAASAAYLKEQVPS